jgi:hypothetical protein
MNARTTNGYIWALALLPLLPLSILLEIEIPLLLDSPPFPSQLAVASTVVAALTILSPPIAVLLAFLDWRRLGRAGHETRFSWAWSFFAFAGLSIVYVAGRCGIAQGGSAAEGDSAAGDSAAARHSARRFGPVRVNAILIAAVLVLALVIAVHIAVLLLAVFTTMTPFEAGES